MKHHFPVTFSEIRNTRLFLTGTVKKELQKANNAKAPTRKKKATKKQLKALEQFFAK